MPATTYTVSGNYTNGDGTGAAGRVTFQPTSQIRHAADGIIVPVQELSVDLQDGAFSVTLYGTDDAGWLPADWKWKVTEQIVDGVTQTYTFDLTADTDLASVDPNAA